MRNPADYVSTPHPTRSLVRSICLRRTVCRIKAFSHWGQPHHLAEPHISEVRMLEQIPGSSLAYTCPTVCGSKPSLKQLPDCSETASTFKGIGNKRSTRSQMPICAQRVKKAQKWRWILSTCRGHFLGRIGDRATVAQRCRLFRELLSLPRSHHE